MKTLTTSLLSFSILILSAVLAMRPAQAQSPLVPFVVIGPVGTPSSCTWPVGATVTSGMALCATTSGLYYATNGSPTFNPVAGTQQASPVSSVFGRTGVVVPAAGDYSYTQISGHPTAVNSCTSGSLAGTATINAASNGSISITVSSASLAGCTIQ